MAGCLVEATDLGRHRVHDDVGGVATRLPYVAQPCVLAVWRGDWTADRHSASGQQGVWLYALDSYWGIHAANLRVCEDRPGFAGGQIPFGFEGQYVGMVR